MSAGVLIGRETELAWIEAAVSDWRRGRGSLVLLAGEAGVGKTRFAEEVAESSNALFLRGAGGPDTLAYGPITAVFRDFMRAVPGGLSVDGPLRSHLAL